MAELAALAAASFLAATLVPLPSEAALYGYLQLHPEDAAARGLAEGARVRVSNEWGAIEVELALDPGLARGAAALPHGAGNARTPALRFASEQPGARLIRSR